MRTLAYVLVPLLFTGAGDSDFFIDSDGEDDVITIEIIEYTPPSPYVPSDPPRDLGLPGQGPQDDGLVYRIEDSYCRSDLQLMQCISDAIIVEPDPSDPTDPIDIVILIQDQVERDISTLQVAPARVNWQPRAAEVLINMDTVVYTEAQPQYLTTRILGYTVTVEVVPVWFEWNFGDGSPVLGTRDQGAPFPNHRVSHVYERAGDYFISLRTTWSARFRVEGISSWIPVRGQPVTTDSVGPISAVSKTNRLVYVD